MGRHADAHVRIVRVPIYLQSNEIQYERCVGVSKRRWRVCSGFAPKSDRRKARAEGDRNLRLARRLVVAPQHLARLRIRPPERIVCT